MSKKTILLICVLVLIYLGFYSLHKMYTQKPPPVPAKILDKNIPSPGILTQCALSITPNSIKAVTGKPSSVNVIIGSDGGYPTSIQLELAYDPKILTDISMTPGNFFPNPNVLINELDESTGRISYAIENLPQEKAAKQGGIIAVMTFTPRSGTTAKETQITFLPKTTVLSGSRTAVIKYGYGTNILISPN